MEVYKYKEGTERLKEYSAETLEKCLSESSKKYIPNGTIINRIHSSYTKKHGGQIVFTKCEDDFV